VVLSVHQPKLLLAKEATRDCSVNPLGSLSSLDPLLPVSELQLGNHIGCRVVSLEVEGEEVLVRRHFVLVIIQPQTNFKFPLREYGRLAQRSEDVENLVRLAEGTAH
jgi:hypothetical protein